MNIEKIEKIANDYFERNNLNRCLAPGVARELLNTVNFDSDVNAQVENLLSHVGQGLTQNERKEKQVITSEALRLLQEIDREVI